MSRLSIWRTRLCGSRSVFPGLQQTPEATLILTSHSPRRNAPKLSHKYSMNTVKVLPAVESFLSRPGKMLIGGQWREAASGQTINSYDPATGQALGTFPDGAKADAAAAVAAARKAFNGPWR